VRSISVRTRSRTICTIISELRQYTKSWKAYFQLAEVTSPLRDSDKWIRRRLRCYHWKQWGQRGYRELRKTAVVRDPYAQLGGRRGIVRCLPISIRHLDQPDANTNPLYLLWPSWHRQIDHGHSVGTTHRFHIPPHYTIEKDIRDLFDVNLQCEGYRLTHRISGENLAVGNSVVADSCNHLNITREDWQFVAIRNSVAFINIETICSNKSEHRHRIETQPSPISNLQLPTWEQVQDREYHNRTHERITIDTSDCIIEQNLVHSSPCFQTPVF